ncbi:ribbon-helix-helix protein, CopG family [Acidianus sp. HS-5]|uniref:ribbon-helix-helix protein, CopG family n=1 Tax=Acidianus sp. HS-5 TaxID=2886040 RepID=UPI001F027FA2|nr:ribbon-helix-helix protein, CopG family [Acidianus sp. HS-5]BDC18207.1 CopG family transcriptional regulator [Acidianus sp. HS-5]
MRVITFKVEEDLLEQLDMYAIKYGLNRSEVIRLAIERLLKDKTNKEIVPAARVEKMRL